MPNLNAGAESQDRQNERVGRHSLHRFQEPSGKAEAMEKSKEKSDREPRPAAGPLRPEDILKRDENDAGCNRRLDHGRGQPEEVEGRKSKRDRVRKSERGDDLNQFPKTADREDQGGHEKKMIVSSENMEQSVTEIIAKYLPAIENRPGTRRRRRGVPRKNERLTAGQKQPFAFRVSLIGDLNNVTGFPPVPWSEFKFVQDIFFQSKFGSRSLERIRELVNETRRFLVGGRSGELNQAPVETRSISLDPQMFEQIRPVVRGGLGGRSGALGIGSVGGSHQYVLQRNAGTQGDLAR
jgi:hypothetical protein